MPYTMRISRKKIILNASTAKIQKFLNDAYYDSGLVQENATKADAEEFVGTNKANRDGLFNKVIILYEDITGAAVGGRERKLPQQKYFLDVPAYKLQQAYVDYLNFIFHKHVNPQNAQRQEDDEDIIDNEHVYLREILIRLFTAALSIDKNNVSPTSEKIIACLEIFLKKINASSILYDKSTNVFSSSSYVSSINIAFANEHKEWIYFLKQMRDVIENIHKHTGSISKLLEVLGDAKINIAHQIIAYLGKKDVSSQEDLLPGWIKYTLFNHELALLQNSSCKAITTYDQANFHNTSSQNYDSSQVNVHQKQIIQYCDSSVRGKLIELYELLAKTNYLLGILEQVDVLFSTTGWVLIITGILNLKSLSQLVEDYSKPAMKVFKEFDIGKCNKENLKKSWVANPLSATDFKQNLDIAISGINAIDSFIIKDCIANIIKEALYNLQALQKTLNCNLVNDASLSFFMGSKDKSFLSAPVSKKFLPVSAKSPKNRSVKTSAVAKKSLNIDEDVDVDLNPVDSIESLYKEIKELIQINDFKNALASTIKMAKKFPHNLEMLEEPCYWFISNKQFFIVQFLIDKYIFSNKALTNSAYRNFVILFVDSSCALAKDDNCDPSKRIEILLKADQQLMYIRDEIGAGAVTALVGQAKSNVSIALAQLGHEKNTMRLNS